MTDDRDFKRLVRARSAKTGESYQAARRVLEDDGRLTARATTTFERPAGRVLGCIIETGIISPGTKVTVTAPDGRAHEGVVVSLRRAFADVRAVDAGATPEFGLLLDPPYYGPVPARITGGRRRG